ncbi:hypothetical protein A3A95_03215 [Candidatus Nomurabacteria bacterium RIFCSPLOWO2_01_FULL_39_18]|uniref:Uncharacterized protein n=1 Tax=Candidatus Nomurabacteria bacterium RIFCSPHIGHO2_01_FULL_40_24b TaxID=1801739 RepID=A0A1F6V8X5_9BACT|nr:MAG: hypothetical protein A2647_00020 [Candidatus Nomurabacteria bacterium RIFCSPHIGHO2_01_FULL_40_24b]OGI90889.1 MAG: hypothetical protein A3A95_03215 [Candidatus Nomurabacteria bacterium RIFCSPLOWO2_01_FULL_39_18]
MDRFKDLGKRKGDQAKTIQMKKDATGEWVMDKEIPPEEEKITDPTKLRAMREILTWFSYDPTLAHLNFLKLRKKYAEAGILSTQEIDEKAKPYIIKSILRSLTEYGNSFDVFMQTMNNWRKSGIINEDDVSQLKKSEYVRNKVTEEIKQLIEWVWKNRKHLGYPEHYTAVLDPYVMSGVVSVDYVQDLWQEQKRTSEIIT